MAKGNKCIVNEVRIGSVGVWDARVTVLAALLLSGKGKEIPLAECEGMAENLVGKPWASLTLRAAGVLQGSPRGALGPASVSITVPGTVSCDL